MHRVEGRTWDPRSTNMASGVLLVFVAVASLTACSAYYLPGTYPQEFLKGQKLRGATCSDRNKAARTL